VIALQPAPCSPTTLSPTAAAALAASAAAATVPGGAGAAALAAASAALAAASRAATLQGGSPHSLLNSGGLTGGASGSLSCLSQLRNLQSLSIFDTGDPW
jgi:hypothetical protein